MSFLGDRILDHLAAVAQEPDLSGTRYRLLGPLGRGGMGTVWAAEDTLLGRDVAIKVTGAHGDRLRREAEVIAGLEHPGIVPVHDRGTLPDGSHYYVMKRVQGVRLDRWRGAGRPMPEALRVFHRMCEAVAFAHAKGILHRDLKPENVMIGELGEVLVMDWGLAKVLGRPDTGSARAEPAPGETLHGTIMGTPGYMAPEQARGDSIDARADVFALGATLRFLLAEAPLPKPLRSILARATAPLASDRYPSAKELAEDVTRLLDGANPLAHRETAIERVGRFASRNRVLLSLLAAYLLVRVLLIAFSRD